MVSKFLRNIKTSNLVKSRKFRTFANDKDNEPTALATDVGKDIPILKGEDAIRFMERMKEVEEEADRIKNEPPSLESLKNQLAFEKIMLDFDLDQVKARWTAICDIEDKIKKLEKNNGKTEEE